MGQNCTGLKDSVEFQPPAPTNRIAPHVSQGVGVKRESLLNGWRSGVSPDWLEHVNQMVEVVEMEDNTMSYRGVCVEELERVHETGTCWNACCNAFWCAWRTELGNWAFCIGLLFYVLQLELIRLDLFVILSVTWFMLEVPSVFWTSVMLDHPF